MSLITELREYLEIDKHSLDDEIVRQPSLFFKVSEAFAEAVAERDACEEELESIDAELDGEARRHFDSNKLKYTEAMAKNSVKTHDRHGSAFDTYILAKQRADKLQALKEAFQQRGYMLRDLASLYVASYYENTSIQGNSRTDSAVYNKQRERMAEARERDKK